MTIKGQWLIAHVSWLRAYSWGPGTAQVWAPGAPQVSIFVFMFSSQFFKERCKQECNKRTVLQWIFQISRCQNQVFWTFARFQVARLSNFENLRRYIFFWFVEFPDMEYCIFVGTKIEPNQLFVVLFFTVFWGARFSIFMILGVRSLHFGFVLALLWELWAFVWENQWKCRNFC